MGITKGKVTAKEFVIEVEGGQHYIPKGCDPIIGPQLEMVAGHEVEVLMANDIVLAIRPIDEIPQLKWPIIVCYLCPPFLAFRPDILMKIEPIITRSLVESGDLDRSVAERLNDFKQFS